MTNAVARLMLKAVSRLADTPTKGHKPRNNANTKLLIKKALKKIKLSDSGFIIMLNSEWRWREQILHLHQ